MNYRTVIIIGAPRSGTNMLRDALCRFNGVGTWPCDEINYIWRHGNVKKETDEFSSEMANQYTKKFILAKFDSLAEKQNLSFVVEKTCANSLRVPFVDKILPNAIYIFIYRDGADVVGSALKRWKAKLDVPYLFRKAKFVPIIDFPYYAWRYFKNRLYRLFSKSERLAFWGPRFHGLDKALSQFSLEEVCALQWERCVDLSDKAFSNMHDNKIIRVSYESLVSSPNQELRIILTKLEINFKDAEIIDATESISDRSVGKGRKNLDKIMLNKVYKLIGDTLSRFGYENSTKYP